MSDSAKYRMIHPRFLRAIEIINDICEEFDFEDYEGLVYPVWGKA